MNPTNESRAGVRQRHQRKSLV